MDLLKKTDEEIMEIANPIWDNLVRASNQKNYGEFTRGLCFNELYNISKIHIIPAS